MSKTAGNIEQVALKKSIFAGLGFGVLGLSFFLVTNSEAILLDGFFSLIGCAVGILTLRISQLILQPADERFHFGYASFEPLMNTIKGLLILAVAGFALVSAIATLLDGGREMDLGWGFVYAIIATGGCVTMALVQRKASRAAGSPLLEVEAKNWTVDALMSLAVALAFGVSFLLQGSSLESYLPYVDPGLVLVLACVALPIPIGIIKQNLGELLLGAPPESAQKEVRDRVASIVKELPVERTEIRMMKVGRERAALVYILVQANTPIDTIDDLDEVREQITAELGLLEPSWVVDVLFVADEGWIH